MIKIGILSDTHLSQVTPTFERQAAACFADTSIIFHAGDLTNPTILKTFAGKKIYAVHGNMCEISACKALPTKTTVKIGNFTVGIIHKSGNSYDFEDKLLDEFDRVDCIVYGHTHQPTCKMVGHTMLVNPGSFMATGRHGAPGTYAIMEVDHELRCSIHEVPR
jgi:putative phosphoesterase